MNIKEENIVSNSFATYEIPADAHFHIYLKKDDMLGSEKSFHRSIEFVYLLEGEIVATIGEEEFVVKPNQMVFADSYQYHTYKQVSKNVLAYVIVLSIHYLNSFNLEHQTKTFIPFMDDVNKNILIKEKIDNWIKQGNLTVLKNFGYTDLFLSEIIDQYGLIDKKEREDDLIFKLLIYINENYTKTINLNSIAKNFGYSSEYISRVFKKTLHVGIREYLTNLRVILARQLMKQGDLSMLEICYKCGFSSPATFYRALKIPETINNYL
ncbi:MAG: helix-turn-helix transcriptional regulator [Bacilli bacterium]|nr:helix-turn-helix transcriptional regulator [Bacilli bacterium]